MSSKRRITMICVVICLGIIFFAGYTFAKSYFDRVYTHEEEDEVDTGVITYQGKRYRPDTDVKSVLFLGIDTDVVAEEKGYIGESGRADSINLFVYNKKTKESQMLQISRDTMVDVDIFDENYSKILTTESQLAVQYAFSDGKKRSCRLMEDRVSEILYGVKIKKYLALTLDGMTKAADVLGGVEMEIPDDYTWIDPVFVQGTSVVLDANLTEKYVRSRDTSELESNNDRMKRQADYMTALMKKLQNLDVSSKEYLKIYDEMEPYMVTNLSADEMIALQTYDFPEVTMQLPGTITSENQHARYWLDAEKVQEIVMELFYKEI